VVPCNLFGAATGTAYLGICWGYATLGRASRSWGRSAAVGTSATLLLIAVSFLYARNWPENAERLGFLAMFSCLARFASPLSVVQRVIAERSSLLLPPAQCSVQFMNCLLWVIVGVRSGSGQVLVCNALGCSLAAVQLLLIAIFPRTEQDFLAVEA